jgi:choline dehydrogenase-like flavoprotein
VGAGPVGLATAFRLQDQGFTVTLLEAGGGASASTPGPIEFTNRHHAFSQATSRPGLGGTSALWGGRCVALDDLDFQPRPHVPFAHWPIRHEDLRGHYAAALRFLGCSTTDLPLRELAKQDPCVTSTALERWSEQPDLGPVYEEILKRSSGIRLVLGAKVTVLHPAPDGTKIEHIEAMIGGQRVAVRAQTYILAGGGLENARLLLQLKQDPVAGPRLSPRVGQFYQGHLTGYIAVLRLNEPKLARALSLQPDEEGRMFRQRFQIAPAVQLQEKLLNSVFWIDSISIADPIHGSGALSFGYLLLALTGLYGRLSKGMAPTARGVRHIRLRQHLANVARDWRWPLDLFSIAWKPKGKQRGPQMLYNPEGRYLLRYHAEQVPDPDSRVMLASSHEGGVPTLSVDYRVVEQDVGSVLHSHRILDDWLRRNGIGQLEYLHEPEPRRKAVLDQAFDGFHQIGLTRMADDPVDGAADADSRVHGIGNLYLAGSGLFPTGGHANPTLPAVALALRLADHLGRIAGKASDVRTAG